jgi:hypothetical protein
VTADAPPADRRWRVGRDQRHRSRREALRSLRPYPDGQRRVEAGPRARTQQISREGRAEEEVRQAEGGDPQRGDQERHTVRQGRDDVDRRPGDRVQAARPVAGHHPAVARLRPQLGEASAGGAAGAGRRSGYRRASTRCFCGRRRSGATTRRSRCGRCCPGSVSSLSGTARCRSSPVASTAKLRRGAGDKKEVVALKPEQWRRPAGEARCAREARQHGQVRAGRSALRARIWFQLPELQCRACCRPGCGSVSCSRWTGDDVDPDADGHGAMAHLVREPGVGMVRMPYRKGNGGSLDAAGARTGRSSSWRRLKMTAGDGPLFPSFGAAGWTRRTMVDRIKEAFTRCRLRVGHQSRVPEDGGDDPRRGRPADDADRGSAGQHAGGGGEALPEEVRGRTRRRRPRWRMLDSRRRRARESGEFLESRGALAGNARRPRSLTWAFAPPLGLEPRTLRVIVPCAEFVTSVVSCL